MKKFRFQLEVALGWRRQRASAARAKVEQKIAELEALAGRDRQLEQSLGQAEDQVLRGSGASADDLAALENYRRGVAGQRRRIERERQRTAEEAGRARKVLIEEMRQCELLEKLKSRKLSEWQRELDRRTEGDAAESFLANWNR